MRHVDEQGRADGVRDLAHLGEVDPPRVRRVAGDEDERLELAGVRQQLVVVDQLGLGVSAVGALVEHLARDVGPEAVGEMAADVEAHAHDPLSREREAQGLPVGLGQLVDVLGAELLQRGRLDPVGEDRPVGHQVGVDARVRLHVGVLGAEQLPCVLGGDRLDRVDVLAARVEAVPHRALGVLVAQPVAHREQRRQRGVVLGRDQLERAALVGQLGADGGADARLHAVDDGQGLGVRAGRGGGEIGHGEIGHGGAP